MNIDNYTKQFFTDLPFLSDISQEHLKEFVESINIKAYEKGQALFFRGDKADRFFIILSGWVKLHRETPEGDESVVAVLNRGGILGKSVIFTKADYQFSAVAVENSTVIEIPAKVFKEIIFKDKAMMERLMITMEKEVRHRQMESEHLSIMSAAQRVACFLLELFSKLKIDNSIMVFPYDKSLAAARLGMKPETFSRALYQLRSLGVYAKGGDISISSIENLKDFACNNCSALPGECLGYKDDCKVGSCYCK